MDYSDWLCANDRQFGRSSWADYAAAAWGWTLDFARQQFDYFRAGVRDIRLHDNTIELSDSLRVLA